ncbi:hypothetical protein CASFOL_009436 [Castilleja foliolosa]|uniref:CCHC-type domain-containing protein n=1 Tax=Castilleja foliolosa TaxID=1961234 RepID=A0ABD3DZ58_9LAMI
MNSSPPALCEELSTSWKPYPSLSSMENLEELATMNIEGEVDPHTPLNHLHPTLNTNTSDEATIIAKIIAPKPINMNAFKSTMLKAWNPSKKTSTNLLENNTMAFVFENEEDLEKIINNAWTFRDHQMVVTRWPPDKSLPEVNLNKTVFWIHAIGVPVSYTNMRSAMVIGDEIGKFIKTDLSMMNQKWKKSILILVEIDIQKPLQSMLSLPCSGRPRLLVEIRYERLVDFCYSCGFLGHKLANCLKPIEGEPNNRDTASYGPWMKIENSQIPNPNFKAIAETYHQTTPVGKNHNPQEVSSAYAGKSNNSWSIPKGRQPAKPNFFLRHVNINANVPFQRTVDPMQETRKIDCNMACLEDLIPSDAGPLDKNALPSSEIAGKRNDWSVNPLHLSAPPGFFDKTGRFAEKDSPALSEIGPGKHLNMDEPITDDQAHIVVHTKSEAQNNLKRKFSGTSEYNTLDAAGTPVQNAPTSQSLNQTYHKNSETLIDLSQKSPNLDHHGNTLPPNKKPRSDNNPHTTLDSSHEITDHTSKTQPTHNQSPTEPNNRKKPYQITRSPDGKPLIQKEIA